jgi:FMN-dependent NADH-azoreductase
MAKILYIKSSPRGNESYSTRAAEAFLASFLAAYREYQSETLDLFSAVIPDFRAPASKAKYAVMSGQVATGEAEQAWKAIIDTINHFKSADAYVVSAPMWNFGIPHRLKAYIDVIAQPGLTFSFSPQTGYKGLVTGRPIVLVLARGGAYGSGSGGEAYDHQAPYLRTSFGFIGFTDIRTVLVEPTLAAGPQAAEAALAKAIGELRVLAADPTLVKA